MPSRCMPEVSYVDLGCADCQVQSLKAVLLQKLVKLESKYCCLRNETTVMVIDISELHSRFRLGAGMTTRSCVAGAQRCVQRS